MIREIALTGLLAASGCAPYFMAVNENYGCKEIREVSLQGRKLDVLFATSNGVRKELLDVGECASNVEAKITEDKCGIDVLCRDANGSKAKYVYWLDGNVFTEMLHKRFYVNLRQRR
jgi:hypothetical protein